ncbi:MAG: trans-2-enoyl-CoA reductase family protein [Spirochaetales bacterium]|nr:trans-2-enoyl-CoA reductase family protein [Spirochaetales bacterium]
MLVKPKIINNICLSSHPVGCAADVLRQVEYVRKNGRIDHGPRHVLIIGSSTGYGLASRISAAFGAGAKTIGVAFEKAGSEKGPGTAGFYNTIAFDRLAAQEGLFSLSFNADAFSTETKTEVAHAVKQHLGKIDLLIYSLASPVRTDPVDGVQYRSVLKPIGSEYVAKSIDPFKGEVKIATVAPATPEEVQATVKVMGGEDWQLWVETLAQQGLLSEGFQTVAYSYIGPKVTYPFYRSGTIGKAKEHLEATVRTLDNSVLMPLGGKAYVSVNKALVTRASAVIPAVSLYISLLYKVMKSKGIHEGCIEQIDRLFRTRLYSGKPVSTDEQGLIRIDDWEMRSDVQAEIASLWDQVDASNLKQLADVAGFEKDFLQLNGFAVPGVDYEADLDVAVLENGA